MADYNRKISSKVKISRKFLSESCWNTSEPSFRRLCSKPQVKTYQTGRPRLADSIRSRSKLKICLEWHKDIQCSSKDIGLAKACSCMDLQDAVKHIWLPQLPRNSTLTSSVSRGQSCLTSTSVPASKTLENFLNELKTRSRLFFSSMSSILWFLRGAPDKLQSQIASLTNSCATLMALKAGMAYS